MENIPAGLLQPTSSSQGQKTTLDQNLSRNFINRLRCIYLTRLTQKSYDTNKLQLLVNWGTLEKPDLNNSIRW